MVELGIGLMELGMGLRINNARRTVWARVSGLVLTIFVVCAFRLRFTHFDMKSKRFELEISAWRHFADLMKLFPMVTDFYMILS